MKTLYCDICKKELVNPVSGRTYWHFREYDVCEPCKDAINLKLRPVLRKHVPYSQEWYENEFMAIIEKGVSSTRP